MGTERNKVLLYRTDKSGNTPLASDIEHGEITLNYNSETPFIAFKDTEDNIQKIGTLQDVYTKSEIYNKTEVDELIDGIEHKLTSEYESVEYPTTSTVSFTAATADQTLDEAIHTVETNVSTLVSEVLKDEKVIAAAITEIKESAGFDINLKYVKDSNATYISAATSLSEADSLLDNAIAGVANSIPDISVKQDKLTAGNGISISSDNVISLDYTYDLFEIVETLPTSDIDTNKIYVIKSEEPGDGNEYIEYIYINDKWEIFGKFAVDVDLSGYYTKEEIDEIVSGIKHELSETYTSIVYPTVEETDGIVFTASKASDNLDTIVTNLDTNVSTLVTEVLKDEKAIAAAITEIKESTGFDTNLKYVKDSNATYISAATTLSEADSLLDNAIADVNSNITNLSTLVDAFGSNKQLKELDLVRVWTLGSAKDKGKEYLTEEEIAWFDALKAESKEGYAYVGRGEWNTTGTIYEGIENMFFAGDEHDSYIFPSVNVVNDEGMTFCYYDTVNNDVRCYLIDYNNYCVYQMMWNITNDDGLVNTHDFAHHQSTDDKYEVIHAITYDLTNKNLRHELYKTLFIVSDNGCKGCLNGLTKQLTIISYNEFDEIVTFKDFQKNKMYQSTITYNEDKTTATIDNLVEITSDTPNFVLDGDGTKYLSDDGSYKEVQHKLTSEYESVVYPTNTGDKVFTPATAEQTLDDAIHTVDSNIVTLTNAVLENEEVISAAITTLNESCGFDENGLYVQFTEGKYINSATSLSEATNVLDYTIGNIEEKVDNIEIQAKDAKEVFIITSDMFEQTATTALRPPTLIFTDGGWSDLIEAIEANKIVALDSTVSKTLMLQAIPMAISRPKGYFILTGLNYHSNDDLIIGFISFAGRSEPVPAVYQITFENKVVDSTVINIPSEIYHLDINNYSTTEDYNNLEEAVRSNKLIVLEGYPAVVVYDNNGIMIDSHHLSASGNDEGETIINYIRYIFKSDGTIENQSCYYYVHLKATGDGTKFLSDDGTYKEIVVPTKVSELEDDISIVTLNDSTPLVQNLAGDELIPIKQNGENKAVTIEQIKDNILTIPSKYEFVDLGLPSGTKWATCNVGASKPEEYGLYFAWGETEGYSGITSEKGFYWGDYKYSSGQTSSTSTLFKGVTKYNSNSSSGTVDNLTVLEQVDDAAYTSDNTCRMPTKADFEELTANTTSVWETLNGVNGRRFTSKTNGNSIFVPAAGGCFDGSVNGVGSNGGLWSSSLDESNSRDAWGLGFVSDGMGVDYGSRYNGLAVRAVQPSNIPITINLKDLKDKVDNIEPYIWDGETISETIANELLKAVQTNREIIVTTEGYLNWRLIGSTFISGTLTLTFCNTFDAPNFLFTDYYITPNSVEYKQTSFYNKRDSDNTRLNTAFYNNPGLITQDTTFTNKGSLSSLEYDGQFNFGDTIYNITFPSGVKWSTDSVLDYKPNHTYQFKIVRGFGVMKEFAN